MAGINLMDRHMAIAASPHIENQNGSITFTKKALAMPVKKMLVDIEPLQSGSGDPSPDNVRPITGRDSVTVVRTGKNLFDKPEVVDGAYINDNDGSERQSADSKATGWIPVVPGEKYYILTEQTMGGWGAWYDRNKTFIGKIVMYLPSGSQKEQTAPSNAAYMRLTCYRNGSGNIDTFAVNHPSTDHDYHAYDGQSAIIQLGQTVYGGTLDVTTGVLTVTMAEVDLGSLAWGYSTGYNVSYFATAYALPNCKKTNIYAHPWYLCENYLAMDAGYVTILLDKSFFIGNSNSRVYIRDSSYTDAASFKAAMSGVQLVYELATPQTYQLTPTEVKLLLGDNNVWADTGNITMKFWSH